MPSRKNDNMQLASAYNRAAKTYDKTAVLAKEVATRLLERLDWVRLQPKVVADLGCGTGITTTLLMKRYPNALVVGIDVAEQMLRVAKRKRKLFSKMTVVNADVFYLPLPDQSVDLIVSHFMLYCIRDNDLSAFFQECHRVLKPGGLIQFTTLGPHTLLELRQAWDEKYKKRQVRSFMDMHDVGDLLMQNQLINPVLDGEFFTLTYPNLKKLFSDFKLLGESQFRQQSIQTIQNELSAEYSALGLIGKNRWRQFSDRIEQCRNDQGLLPISFEVIYGHAWKSDEAKTDKSFSKDEAGNVRIPVSAIRVPAKNPTL